ncbi:hypothetical protein Tco_0241216 [Tanacetum coccineum]
MSTYEAAASLSKFELTKILIDKMEKNKSYDEADYKKKLYDALVESYNTDKDLFDSYGKVFSLKRTRDDNSRSKEKKSSSTSKDVSQSQHKSSDKSAHAEEPSHMVEDLVMQQDQEFIIRRIIVVTRLKIMKMYDYGHLEEIEVRRDDQKLYTFKEGDFKRLRLQDIEDMLLLLVQQKLANLTIDEWYDLNVALRMYTRRIIIQRRVADLQLGVKSYQKKLNLTKPDTINRNRLMRADELHKFSDGTLDDVRSTLNDIAKGIRMEYLPIRRWSNLDKKRARVMVQDIDKQLYQRRLMQNLENYKVVKFRYSFLSSSQNWRDLPKDIPLDSVVVFKYERRSKSENKGRVPTEMELVLEQTQQGTSYEVSVSVEEVEELKRKVKIKGEQKEALITLRQKPGQYICCQESQR